MYTDFNHFHCYKLRRILHIRWKDYVTNDEVLRRTGLLPASSIVRKRRLGLFGHVARLADDVPANQILQTCCKVQDGVRPSPDWRRARGRPLTTWIHQIRRDTGIPVTDALELTENSSFWRQIATAGCYGWSPRATMMMMKLQRIKVKLRLPPHIYSVTTLPSKTHYCESRWYMFDLLMA